MQIFDYIISLGSNAGEAAQYMTETSELLRKEFPDIVFSPVVPTKGIDVEIDCFFLNAAVRIKTTMNPNNLKIFLKEIEKKIGRTPHSPFVLIDLDIIMINGDVVHEDYENREFLRKLIEMICN